MNNNFYFVVDDVYDIKGRGALVEGKIHTGRVEVSERYMLYHRNGTSEEICVTGIVRNKELVYNATEGEYVGILLRNKIPDEIEIGDILGR